MGLAAPPEAALAAEPPGWDEGCSKAKSCLFLPSIIPEHRGNQLPFQPFLQETFPFPLAGANSWQPQQCQSLCRRWGWSVGQQHPSPLLGEGVMEDNSCGIISCGKGKLQDLKTATCVLSKETDDCWRCAMLGCNLAHVLAINPAQFLTNLLEIVIAPALQGLVLC